MWRRLQFIHSGGFIKYGNQTTITNDHTMKSESILTMPHNIVTESKCIQQLAYDENRVKIYDTMYSCQATIMTTSNALVATAWSQPSEWKSAPDGDQMEYALQMKFMIRDGNMSYAFAFHNSLVTDQARITMGR